MKRIFFTIGFSAFVVFCTACYGVEENPVPGAYRIDQYIHLIDGKSVAVVANQTSMVGKKHLVDTLLSLGIKVNAIFAPEHGFRDLADAGDQIRDGKDIETGVRIISLYGGHLKPTPGDLKGIDVVMFDIQDVGVRFYTYISTLHYVLEACAENNVECIVLDRPNPNGFYFDGNVADTVYRSFVGIDPVPVVHGMTAGEYAGMINGEGWLKNGVRCKLTVIKCSYYTHKTFYEPPVKPSPNLPNLNSIYLYPSICFFEGTNISLGRGTPFPFQVYGSPKLPDTGFSFTPESVPGAKNPPHLGEKCYGVDLRNAIKGKIVPSPKVNLEWIIDAYNRYPEKDEFFTSYFDVLASGPSLREQIQRGMSAEEIRATWKDELERFGKIRQKYLLYE
ncbi:MAG TPA: DUF1343 domain-containing protein [Bacteroidales bacterium]|jgi:uncharacterized protein YbbC (DUF1343 family)|nr:DUF1343 domain-containing protein [Bacteroidales bacterium]HBZ21806.1 DUF1343 domain-containing protein [Bacteroidales bacterium]